MQPVENAPIVFIKDCNSTNGTRVVDIKQQINIASLPCLACLPSAPLQPNLFYQVRILFYHKLIEQGAS